MKNMNNIERQLQLCPGKIENGLRDFKKIQLENSRNVFFASKGN